MAAQSGAALNIDPNSPDIGTLLGQATTPQAKWSIIGAALRQAAGNLAGDYTGDEINQARQNLINQAMSRQQVRQGIANYGLDQAFTRSLLNPAGSQPAGSQPTEAPTSIAATLAANPPQAANTPPSSLAAAVAPASQPLSSAPPPQPQPASLSDIAANQPAPLPQGGDDALFDLGIGPEGTNQTAAAPQAAAVPSSAGVAPAASTPVMTGPQFAALVQQQQAQKRAAAMAALGVGSQGQAPQPPPGTGATAASAQAAGSSPLATQRAFLAARALRNGDPAGAAKILSDMGGVPDMEVANGVAYDKHNTAAGTRIGVNLTPSASGVMVDPNNPANTNRDIGTAPPVPGAKPAYDAGGNLTAWTLPNGTVQAIAATEAAKAGASAQVTAPYTPVTTYNADGSPNVVSAAQFAAQGSGALPAPGQPSGAPTGGGIGNGFVLDNLKRFTTALAGDENGAGAAIPGYRQALDTSGDYLSLQKAFQMGQTHMTNSNVPAATVADTVAGLSPPELQAYRGGMANKVFNLDQQGSLKPSKFSAPIIKGKLTAALGAEPAAAFLKSAANEKLLAMSAARMMPGNGSPTAEFANAMGEQDGRNPLADFAIDVGQGVLKGQHPRAAAVAGLLKGANGIAAGLRTPGMSVPVRDEAGRILQQQMTRDELNAYLKAISARNAGKGGVPVGVYGDVGGEVVKRLKIQ